MQIGIVYGDPFGGGGGVKLVISGHQRNAARPAGLKPLMHFEGSGELHGVIRPQGVGVGKPHRGGQQGGGDLDGNIPAGEVAAESRQDGADAGGGQDAALWSRAGAGQPGGAGGRRAASRQEGGRGSDRRRGAMAGRCAGHPGALGLPLLWP